MSFYSDAHLLLGGEPTVEVDAWQHPANAGSFTVNLATADRHGRIAITGSPRQLVELLGRMTQAITTTAAAAGQLPTDQEPAEPAATTS